MTDPSPWYAARLLFETGPQDAGDALFEERIVLIHTSSGIEEAGRKATQLGRAGEEAYENANGDKVKCRFREVLDLVQLIESEIGDGSEVYYHFLKSNEVEEIRESLKPGSLG